MRAESIGIICVLLARCAASQAAVQQVGPETTQLIASIDGPML